MWVRLQLDIGWGDLAFGLSQLVFFSNRASLQESIRQEWQPETNVLATLSVRSALDLVLGTMQWASGDEVIFSALNIPDMSMVARQHGLVPVPVDLDLDQLAPDMGLLEKAITPKTRAILVAHLYGSFVPMEPILALARRHGLMVIEDCAENYDGQYMGHPETDVSLFSFGPLKTITSLAGGVIRVRDTRFYQRLEAHHARWPGHSRRDFFNRICKYGTMKFFGERWIYPTVRRVARLLVGDVDNLIRHSAKSFREDEIMKRLRQQPCGPLLASMRRRFARFDPEQIRKRTSNGNYLADLLRGHVFCPGADAVRNNYWLFPVLMTDPQKALLALEHAGFDASQAQSMSALEAPPDRPDLDPVNAKKLLQQMILLPCYPAIPEPELKRMAGMLIQVEKESSLASALRITSVPTTTMYNGKKPEPVPHESAEVMVR